MDLHAGILLIGSLYWETTHKSHRQEWRNDRLDISAEFYVRVPIRYGRRSHKRNDTYTMVFSQLCQRTHKCGQAIVIPCQQPLSSHKDLIHEAKQLWWAEQSCRPAKSDIGLATDWGCVALLTNPKGQKLPPEWRDAWMKTVSETGQRSYGGLKCASDEEPIVDASGMLKIDWPRAVDSGKLGQLTRLDLLLATANEPDLVGSQYASSQAIANAWIRVPGEARYFRENRKSGIETFQDESINALLSAARVP